MKLDQAAKTMSYDMMYAQVFQSYISHLMDPKLKGPVRDSLVRTLKDELNYGYSEGLDDHIDALFEILFKDKITFKLKPEDKDEFERTIDVNPKRKHSLIEYQLLKIFAVRNEDYASAAKYRNQQAKHLVEEHMGK